MSLTTFIKRPRISKAFDEFASKKRTPPEFKQRKILVPEFKPSYGLAGTAFDYLARMKIIRAFEKTDIAVHRRHWISEDILSRFEGEPESFRYPILDGDVWIAHLKKAQSAVNQYLCGEGCLSCLMLNVQFMAHADLLARAPGAFEEFFQPSINIAHELECLLELFDPASLFRPKNSVILNPTFALSVNVGGADADLIVDDRLIDFKASKLLAVTKGHLLQLSGYKVLADLGGVDVDGGISKMTINSIGVHFPRYNVLYEIEVEDLFPDGGYDKFKAVFEDELRIFERKFIEQQREWDEFIAQTKERRISAEKTNQTMN